MSGVLFQHNFKCREILEVRWAKGRDQRIKTETPHLKNTGLKVIK